MRLHVSHRSEYRFTEPQARLVQLLRLTPGNHAGQSVIGWTIDVDRDARLKPSRDGYGNETTMLYVDGPIDAIAVSVSGDILTEDQAGILKGAPEPLPPVYFVQSTPLTQPDAAVRDFVAGLGLPLPRLAAAHMLAETVHHHLSLEQPHLAASRSASAVFAARKADAEGAAHLLIASARAARFPARFVAGYVYRPSEPAAHAAHGWAELYVEGYGWIGFDAHDGRCPTEFYVRVAIGLDSAEAAPIGSARIGGGSETVAVNVEVGAQPQ